MRTRLLSIYLLLGIAGSLPVIADDSYRGNHGQNLEDRNSLFSIDKSKAPDVDTVRIMNRQAQDSHFGNNIFFNRTDTQDQNHAESMANMLRDEQLQKVLGRVTERGNDLLKRNSELQNPAAVIAGAVSLWYGRTLRLIKGDDVSFFTRIQARDRSGEVWMNSPILNGRLHFTSSEGFDITMNRKISSINSQAEVNYNMKSQAVSTQLRHHLIPNLDFTFGSSQIPVTNQMDHRAGVEYQISF